MKSMKRFTSLLIVVSGLFISPAISSASEWYKGGTLTNSGALDWQEATIENKLASSGDIFAVLFQNRMLNNSILNKINSIEDIKPYASALSICLENFTKKDLDPEENHRIYANQTVSSMATLCVIGMGWGK